MNKRIFFALLVLVTLGAAMSGCKSWAPAANEPGECAVDRQWVPPQQDAKTGEWKEGKCEWMPGKAG